MRKTGLILAFLLTACRAAVPVPVGTLRAVLVFDDPLTRSADPPEDRVEDVNVLLFNEEGLLETRQYLSGTAVSDGSFPLTLPLTLRSHILTAVNFGYPLDEIRSWEEAKNYRFRLTYPDEYSRGMPSCGILENYIPGDRREVRIPMRRLMARIDLCLDRRGLDEDVSLHVRSVEVGNCPRSAALAGPSGALSKEDLFQHGFFKSYGQVDGLNRDVSPGVSETVSLYLLENEDPDPSLRSFVEVKCEYRSPTQVTRPDEYLVYRFFLNMEDAAPGVVRNRRYRVTVRPEGDGLSGDGWAVDKSGLTTFGPGRITLHPADQITARVGEQIHIWADLEPPDAPFDVGLEELEEDHSRGLYDYTIDPDGHGVTLLLKAPGTGIVYFQAGWPVTDYAGALIVINE